MTDDETQAYADAEAAAEAAAHDRPAALLELVADKLGLHAGARAVFGEPVERKGVTVIPVAQMIIGTGGGGGTAPEAEGGSGVGAGGGALTRPLGYIELDDDGATFQPIPRPWQNAGLVVSVAFSVLLLAKAMRTLVRG